MPANTTVPNCYLPGTALPARRCTRASWILTREPQPDEWREAVSYGWAIGRTLRGERTVEFIGGYSPPPRNRFADFQPVKVYDGNRVRSYQTPAIAAAYEATILREVAGQRGKSGRAARTIHSLRGAFPDGYPPCLELDGGACICGTPETEMFGWLRYALRDMAERGHCHHTLFGASSRSECSCFVELATAAA